MDRAYMLIVIFLSVDILEVHSRSLRKMQSNLRELKERVSKLEKHVCFVLVWSFEWTFGNQQFVEDSLTRGHQLICSGRRIHNVGSGVASSRELRAAFHRLQRKARRIAVETNALLITYNDDRIETPVNESNLPQCLAKINFKDVVNYTSTTTSLTTMLHSDFHTLAEINGILAEMKREEDKRDEGIYSDDLKTIRKNIKHLMCEMYNVNRMMGSEESPRVISPLLTICRAKCRGARYIRDVYLLMQFKKLAISFRNKYIDIKNNHLPQ